MATKTRPRPKNVSRADASAGGPERGKWRSTTWIIWLLLAVTTLAAYWPVLFCDFAGSDDTVYASDNWHISRGLCWPGVDWAFSDLSAGFWHPLTWLSLMLDVNLFGLHAGGFHLTNMLLHLCSTLLLFSVLQRMTGARWRSAMVAALFAVHPLHVEAVAWIAERKEVLSAFFGLLSLWAYIRYAARNAMDPHEPASAPRIPSARFFYWLSVFFFACGLMSKTMVVTLPVVLLLLDWWPLTRSGKHEVRDAKANAIPPSTINYKLSTLPRLVLEKLPFFALAIIAGLLTIQAEKHIGATPSSGGLPLAMRASNAVVSCLRYLGQTFWPVNLAVFYPYPRELPLSEVAAAAAIVLAIFVVAALRARRNPYLAMGWLWFVITLLPVSGLVQVGSHSRADRYTYVPLIGIFIMIVWGVGEFIGRIRGARVPLGTAAVAVVLACVLRTRDQLRYWQNPEALFGHAIAVTQDNYLAYNNRGYYLMNNEGKYDAAIDDFEQAIRINPREADAYDNLGFALAAEGQTARAIVFYESGLKLNQRQPNTHNDYANALSRVGRLDEAITQYQLALREKPDYSEAHNNLGIALVQKGRLDDAMKEFSAAIQSNPYSAIAHNSLGNVYVLQQHYPEAVREYDAALRLQPDYDQAQNDLGYALAGLGRYDEAIPHYHEAIRLNPGYANAHYNLGCALAAMGHRDEGVAEIKEALHFQPDYPDAGKELAELGVTPP